jgi:hypothetical protein
MTREQALDNVCLYVDDALAERSADDMPDNARLVGWQCGFEPMFVAVWSYLGVRLSDEDAEEIATDILKERAWFAGEEPAPPDYIL